MKNTTELQTERLEIRLKLSEKNKVAKDARKCGMSVGTYIRTLIMTRSPIPFLSDEDREQISKMYALKSVLTNLHDLFKKKLSVETEAMLQEVLDQLNIYFRKLNNPRQDDTQS